MSSALDNIKVLDLSRVPTGSYCTMIMGDLGAEVLKVETPLSAGERQAGQGIPLKGTGTKREIAFNALDRNKKSIALNLKTDEGKKVIFQLVKQFDVFLECFRPGVAGRLGIDYNSLSKLNPKLVYCSLTGWGQDGPRRNFPGHDLNFIAASGALNLIGEKGRKPVIPLNLVADYAGGSLLCVIGILAALWAREKTGRGQYVDIAMADGALSLLSASPVAADFLLNAQEPKRGETIMSGGYPFYNTYLAGDGKYVALGCAEPWFWENFCRAIGKEDLIPFHLLYQKPLTGKVAVKLRKVTKELEKTFLARTSAQWVEFLGDKDIPISPVNSLKDVFNDPQVIQRKMLIELKTEGLGTVRQTGIPVKMSDTPGAVRRLAPALGENTDEILAGLGYSNKEIEELRKKGAAQ